MTSIRQSLIISMSVDHDELKPKSKTQQKRETEAVQLLGAKLVELSVTQINELSDKLHEVLEGSGHSIDLTV